MAKSKHCPSCGHRVNSLFDHVHVECRSDMSDAEIAGLLRSAENEVSHERDYRQVKLTGELRR